MKIEELYINLYPAIKDFIYKVSWFNIDYLNIEECINKGFYDFYKKNNNIDINVNYTNYIGKFVYNAMLNSYKYKKRYYNKNISLEDYHFSYYTNNRDLLSIILENEFKSIFINIIRQLNNVEKKIIIYYFYYDYSYKEISIMLNIKYSNVIKIKNNAINNLRNYINSNYGDYFKIKTSK